ncbi:hypothetical protein J2T13_002072 [Paenibacillus sp. DS2015]|uniref:hypothetical protein n=1 Tax=Paenibacillus sp. DS2015 TaxID=3373917 RepID=UPI003D24D8E6
MSQIEKEVKPYMVQILNLLGSALESGNMTDVNKFIDKYVTESTAENAFQGRQVTKDNLKNFLTNKISFEFSGTKKEYISILKKADANDISGIDPYKSDSTINFDSTFYPQEGFNLYAVRFIFSKLSSGVYSLDAIYVL